MGKIFRFLVILLVIGLITLLALGFFVSKRLNAVDFHSRVEEKFSDWLGGKVRFGAARIHWGKTSWGIETSDLWIQGKRGAVPLMELGTLSLELDPVGFFLRRSTFYELRAKDLRIHLVRGEDGSENWTFIRGKSSVGKKESKGLGPKVEKIIGGIVLSFSGVRVEGGSLHFRDERRQTPFELGIEDIRARVEPVIPARVYTLRGNGRFVGKVPEDIGFDGTFDLQKRVLTYRANLGKDQIKIEGEIGLERGFDGRASVEMKDTDLKELSALLKPGETARVLEGIGNGSLKIEGSGSDLEGMKKSLEGSGKIQIQNGRLRGVNLIAPILRKIAVVPGIETVWTGALPQEVQELFWDRDTRFDRLETEWILHQSKVRAQSLFLATPTWSLVGEGEYDLEAGSVQGQGKLILAQGISKYLMKKVRELAFLQDSEGSIVIPFRVRGKGGSIRPQPDIGSLAGDLVTKQGERLLEKGMKFLSKWSEKRSGGTTG